MVARMSEREDARLIVRPLWWITADERLCTFDRSLPLEPGDRALLGAWSVSATVDEVAARVGRPAEAVWGRARHLLDSGVLAPEPVRPAMPGVELEVTGACQADCVFCPREQVRVSRGFAHMTDDVFAQVLANVGGRGVPFYCLCGIGEPFLHPRWAGFARALRAADPQARISAYTNGWALRDDIRDEVVASPIDLLEVSVHSTDPATRSRMMGLPPGEDVLLGIDRLLASTRAVGRALRVCVSQVQLPGQERDESLAAWCAERGLLFEWGPVWNRGGNVRLRGMGNAANVSPHACDHFASVVFIDHRGNVLACCCDASGVTAELSACRSSWDDVVTARLRRLASGRPLSVLCATCDTPLSNRPFLETSFYAEALAGTSQS